MSLRMRRIVLSLFSLIGAALAFTATAGPAHAHGFVSTVYAEVTGSTRHPRTTLELEYDLLVVSAADAGDDDPLFRDGTEAFENGDAHERAAALEAHAATVVDYVTDRFTLATAKDPCVPRRSGAFAMTEREDVPYAVLRLDWDCAGSTGLRVSSRLFPGEEQYVRGATTVVSHDVDGLSGSAALDAGHPSFTVGEHAYQRFAEFFRLGAEHLLLGIDHVLFLIALIIGSRGLREIVLTATSFTAAHSVTFLLAALGLVEVPARVVEPVIALSIAVVAAHHLWRTTRRRTGTGDPRTTGPLHRDRRPLDRAGRTRLAVVFCFGLVHGLGFAGALGIDAAWSWTLLWSLLVFNIGIEAAQLAVIAVAFPALAVLRTRAPRTARAVTTLVAAAVTVTGLFWCVQRLSGA